MPAATCRQPWTDNVVDRRCLAHMCVYVCAAMMAKALGDDFDIEIVEGHHHHKVDAPSG